MIFIYLAQVVALDSLRSQPLVRSLLFDKADVAGGRLIAFALFAACLFMVVTIAWRPVRAGQPLALQPSSRRKPGPTDPRPRC